MLLFVSCEKDEAITSEMKELKTIQLQMTYECPDYDTYEELKINNELSIAFIEIDGEKIRMDYDDTHNDFIFFLRINYHSIEVELVEDKKYDYEITTYYELGIERKKVITRGTITPNLKNVIKINELVLINK